MRKRYRLRLVLSIVVAMLVILGVITWWWVTKPNNTPEIEYRTLSFVVGETINDKYFANQVFNKGDNVNEPTNYPIIANKMFDGWYKDEEYKDKVKFPFNIDEDTTIYAKYLDGNVPKENIAYTTNTHEYIIQGVLGDIESDTLVIPDAYDDGVYGISKITKITNISGNRSFLTENTEIRKLYIGNYITTIPEYFAYNSNCINAVVFGKNVNEIAGTAFKLCSAISEAEFLGDGWYQVNAYDLVNCYVEWLQQRMWVITFDTRNQLLLDEGLDGTATNYNHPAFDSITIEITNEPQSRPDLEPNNFPTTVNYRFKCWIDEAGNEVDWSSYIIGCSQTFYAKYQKGNMKTNDGFNFIEYNSNTSTYSEFGYEYKGSYFVKDTNLNDVNDLEFSSTELIIPDIYDDGTNGVAPVTYIDGDSSNSASGILNSNSGKIEKAWLGNNIRCVGDYFASGSYLAYVAFPKYILDGYTYAMDYVGKQSFNSVNTINQELKLSCENIGVNAFYNCDGLTSLDLVARNVKNSAFKACDGITKITIGTDASGEINQIGNNVFYDCTNLASVSISGYVYEMKGSAFSFGSKSDSKLTDLYWNVSRVGTYDQSAFKYIGGSVGADIVIGNAVEEIPTYFMNPSDSNTAVKVLSVTFQDNSSCTEIGAEAFAYCNELTSLELPSSMLTIRNHAFWECGLTSVILNEGLEALESECFTDNNLTEITLPTSIIFMGDAVFFENPITTINYNIIEMDESLTDFFTMTPFERASNTVVNIGPEVRKIPTACFGFTTHINGSSGSELLISELNFAENGVLESIGEKAFWYCEISCDVVIPNSVTEIGYMAFADTRSLKNLSFEAGGSCKLLDGAFMYSGVYSVDFADSVTEIGVKGFYTCNSLKSVVIPESVLYIADSGFQSCENLETIVINGANGPSKFDPSCKGITLGEYAFATNASAKTLTLNGWFCEIVDKAFYGLNYLTTLNINANFSMDFVTDNNIFYKLAYSVTNGCVINVGEETKEIPDYFFSVNDTDYAPKVQSLNLPTNGVLENIGDGAFGYVKKLKTVTIPASVTYVGKNAFKGTSVTSISFDDVTNWWACTNPKQNIWEKWAEATVSDPSLNKTHIVTSGYAYKKSETNPGNS